MERPAEPLRRHFRAAFAADPSAAYRDWFHAQEELADEGRAEESRALADDLWEMLPDLPFADAFARAKFEHNAAVFYGSPGPSADLARAEALFESVLRHFASEDGSGWRARALHNFATALSNLGRTPEELDRSLAVFEEALGWRTGEREIARGVTLHNLGLALRRAAELAPEKARERLLESARALREAIEIRGRNGLVEGAARSEAALEHTLEALEALDR